MNKDLVVDLSNIKVYPKPGNKVLRMCRHRILFDTIYIRCHKAQNHDNDHVGTGVVHMQSKLKRYRITWADYVGHVQT